MDALDFIFVDVGLIRVYGFFARYERYEYLCIRIKYSENSPKESTHWQCNVDIMFKKILKNDLFYECKFILRGCAILFYGCDI